MFFMFFNRPNLSTKNSNPSQEHKPSNQELKPISKEHKWKQEEKIKLNTNMKFSSCSSQIQEATKPISSKP